MFDFIFYRIEFSSDEMILHYVLRKKKVFKMSTFLRYDVYGSWWGKVMFLYFEKHMGILLPVPVRFKEFKAELRRFLPEGENRQGACDG
jgi:hypothetical protein